MSMDEGDSRREKAMAITDAVDVLIALSIEGRPVTPPAHRTKPETIEAARRRLTDAIMEAMS